MFRFLHNITLIVRPAAAVAFVGIVSFAGAAFDAAAQEAAPAPSPATARATAPAPRVERDPRRNLSGPRVGITSISPGVRERLESLGVGVGSATFQIGFTVERRLANLDEFVPVQQVTLLVGGLEQNELLPSLIWSFGVRSRRDFGLGVGAKASRAGLGFALTASAVAGAGGLRIPLSMGLATTAFGSEVTMLGGVAVF